MNILSSYNGDRKNVVIPEGIRMIRGEEIAFGTEFEMEDRRLWEKRVKAPFSRDKRKLQNSKCVKLYAGNTV